MLFLFGIAIGIIGLVYADMATGNIKNSLSISLFSSSETKDSIIIDNIQQTVNKFINL